MEIIKKSKKLIEKILPKNVIKNDAKVRFNKFVTSIDVENNSKLVFNGLTGELILLDNNYDVDDKDYLIDHYYVVNDELDDCKLVRDLREILNIVGQTRTKGINAYTILTTTDCNARCFYCYEKGCEKHDMSIECANNVVDYILRHSYEDNNEENVYADDGNDNLSNATKKNKIKLAWFGGEPLFNNKVIDVICNRLRENNREYYSSMISNGFLFDEELINKASDLWHLKNIQITLDGTKDIYNKTKAYINTTEDGFDRVINNIRLLMNKGIRVSIRLNMNNDNYEDLYRLVDYLYNKFGVNDNYSVYSHLLFQDECKINSDYLRELYDKHLKLQEYINSFGILGNGLNSGVRSNWCMADSLNSVVILPDGRLHSCEHFVNNEIWGSIYNDDNKRSVCYHNDEKITTPLQYWEERIEDIEECKDCFNYPNCIRLKHCPDHFENCSIEKRNEYKTRLEWAILKAYKKHKDSNLKE